MDYTDLKYIVAVSNNQSISKAAEKLFVSQPNISKAIQKVENEIGFKIFVRTTKGVELTPNGEEFVNKAKQMLVNFDDFVNDFSDASSSSFSLNISYPRAQYISYAVCKYFNTIKDKEQIKINIFENNSLATIDYLAKDKISLGIIRINKEETNYYKTLLKQNKLVSSVIYDFRMYALMNKNHPLANKEVVTREDLQNYISIVHANPEIVESDFVNENFYFGKKQIKITERGSQLTALNYVFGSYMLVSKSPNAVLVDNNLVQVLYDDSSNTWEDYVICKKNHRLTKPELAIIDTIKETVKILENE